MKAVSILFGILILLGCVEKPRTKIDNETEIRNQLSAFLDAALDEFTKELGSSTSPWGVDTSQWEEPFVEPDLLHLTEREFARLHAFTDGLRYDRDEVASRE